MRDPEGNANFKANDLEKKSPHSRKVIQAFDLPPFRKAEAEPQGHPNAQHIIAQSDLSSVLGGKPYAVHGHRLGHLG